MYAARILADSLSTDNVRLTTFEVTFPRFILAEFNTHRMLSRNSASSRAIPTEKLIERVENFPFIPDFNHRVTGMGVGEPLSILDQATAAVQWCDVRDVAVDTARALLHTDKSRANRLLEPFMWHTALITATDWSNFFALRMGESAQPEFRRTASMMKEIYDAGEPWHTPDGAWHLPLITPEELPKVALDYPYWRQVSTGRCARVSYLTHHGVRDTTEDVGLHDRLLDQGHMSPFEHVARPFTSSEWYLIHEQHEELRHLYSHKHPQMVERLCRQIEYCGNFRGWVTYRSLIPNEHDFSRVKIA